MSALFRASSVGDLMASPDKDKLPAGAITKLDKMISQKLLNWRDDFDFVALEKGRICENESIELYNEISDTFYVKNIERITKGNLTGECDLIDKSESLVIDIKTAYSKKTFPLFMKMSSLYEWQLRSYMYLYDVNHAELAYCLVDTPHDLRKKYEQDSWYEMYDVPQKYRLSTLRIERNAEKEQQLLNRLILAENYINDALK